MDRRKTSSTNVRQSLRGLIPRITQSIDSRYNYTTISRVRNGKENELRLLANVEGKSSVGVKEPLLFVLSKLCHPGYRLPARILPSFSSRIETDESSMGRSRTIPEWDEPEPVGRELVGRTG